MELVPIINYEELSEAQQTEILRRPTQHNHNIIEQVQLIIDTVRTCGDEGLFTFTKKFDKAELKQFLVSTLEVTDAINNVSEQIQTAIKIAAQNIRAFHEPLKPKTVRVAPMTGIYCEKQPRPIQKVGLYIPAGSAPLVSTVLMLGIPSQIAGNPLRVMVTPPSNDGSIHPAIIYAAKICGIEQIYKIGGAQAIAALAYGTESIPKVNKIFGPGNAWVTQAKMLVAQDPNGAAIDLPAGPSEVMVIADNSAHPQFVAADLLSQAEHGPDSQAILITTDQQIAEQTQKEIIAQATKLSRIQIITQALKHCRIIVVTKLEQAFNIANLYAAEHLILAINNAEEQLANIHAAGSVFCGHYTPEAAGDYASGTNHVLPTYGFAHSYSGLAVCDFMTQMSVQKIDQEGLAQLGPVIETLADLENLDAHKQAVSVRLQNINNLG